MAPNRLHIIPAAAHTHIMRTMNLTRSRSIPKLGLRTSTNAPNAAVPTKGVNMVAPNAIHHKRFIQPNGGNMPKVNTIGPSATKM